MCVKRKQQKKGELKLAKKIFWQICGVATKNYKKLLCIAFNPHQAQLNDAQAATRSIVVIASTQKQHSFCRDAALRNIPHPVNVKLRQLLKDPRGAVNGGSAKKRARHELEPCDAQRTQPSS